MEHYARLAMLMLATASLAAVAAKPTPAPAPAPVASPLQVFDANGKVAGRYAMFFEDNVAAQVAVIDVGGIKVAAILGSRQQDSGVGPDRGLYWRAPVTNTTYFPTTNCSGTPLVNIYNRPASAFTGLRFAATDVVDGQLVLYVGADVAASEFAFGSWKVLSQSGSGPWSAQCFIGAGAIRGVPAIGSVNLSTTYPTPLTVR